MRHLLTAERAVLESLSRSNKSFGELNEDTGVQEHILHCILEDFISVDIVVMIDDYYQLVIFEESERERRLEIKRMLSDFVDIGENLHLQKIWMTPYEKLMFDQLVARFDSFIKSVKKKKSAGLKTLKQEVVVWGHLSYQNLIKQSLEFS